MDPHAALCEVWLCICYGPPYDSNPLNNPQGYDAAAHVLACFGGAGGQHACAIARALGMRTIFVHK